MRRVKVVAGAVQVRAYEVTARAVEEGLSVALQRADKHADDPLTDVQRARILEGGVREVMAALTEVWEFPEAKP